MKIYVRDETYNNLIKLLKEVKLVQGNMALNSTLNRHSKVKKYLINCQIDTLQDLEANIDLN